MILFKRLFVTGFIFSVLQLSTATACNVTATISTNNATTICEGKSVQVRVDIANGTGPYNLVISDTSGAEIFTESNFGGTLVYFSFNQSNTYFVSEIYDLGADCAGTGIDSIVVSVNPAPAATLSGGGSICDDGVSEACLDIELTSGQAPYTFRLIGSESGNLSYNSTNNDYQVCTMSDQDFIWLDLTDNNGCKAESEDLTGNAEIDYFEEPNIFSPIYYCPNGQNAPYVYEVTIEVTPGTGTPTLTSADATFMNTTGNTWVSTPIDENITTTLQLDDENNCSPITLTGLNRVCSCPTNAILTAASGTTFCDDGLNNATLEISTQGGTGPYNFEVYGDVSGQVASEIGHSAFPYVLSVNTDETFTIQSFYDNGEECEAEKSGTVDLVIHPLPTATISGGSNICDGQQADDISIVFTGHSPYTVSYTGNPGAQNVVGVSPFLDISNPGAGTYEVTALTDGNGCTATSNELSGSVNINVHTLPTAILSGGGTICLGDESPTVEINFTGIGHYDVIYSDGNTETTLTGIVQNPFKITNLNQNVGSHNYTLVSVNDVCEATSLTGVATVTINELPTVTLTGGRIICSDGSDPAELTVTFTGTAPFNYTYTEGGLAGVTGTSNSSPLAISTTEDGSHTITEVNDAMCATAEVASQSVTHSDPLFLSVSTSDNSECTKTLAVTGQGSHAIEWSNGETTNQIELSSPSQSGTYTVTADDGICPPSSTQATSPNVQIEEGPTVQISDNEETQFYNLGETISFNATVSESATSFSWSGDEGLNGLVDVNSLNPSFTPISNGVYVYRLTASNGTCTNDEIIRINVGAVGLTEHKYNNPLTIYPNPIEANQAIGIDHEGIGTLSVYSVDGSLILESEYNGSETRVNAPEQSGLFLIKFVDQNGQIFTSPLVIE